MAARFLGRDPGRTLGIFKLPLVLEFVPAECMVLSLSDKVSPKISLDPGWHQAKSHDLVWGLTPHQGHYEVISVFLQSA